MLLRASVLLEKPTPRLPLFESAQRQLQFDLPLDIPNGGLFKKLIYAAASGIYTEFPNTLYEIFQHEW